ncbi:ASST-domain-containing protein, partial [Delphinella strobiligena]
DKSYGLYPNQSYQSTNISSPIFQVNTEAGDNVSNASYVFISPRGTVVGQISPMIINSTDLSLVWAAPEYKTTFGVRVQEYNGSDYLTFWRGTISASGYGSGSCYMLNSSYDVVYNLTTNLTVGSDIHECQLTDDGTALLTAYLPISYDLSAYNITDGWLADSMFQEVDITTGDVLFSWSASDHFELNASYADPGSTGGSEDDAYDFFHINSIEKDASGNYLISGRHVHTLSYINGTNGEVIWHLGGKLNQFSDNSDGNATNFAWQHDARWQNTNLTAVTIFDNGAADWVDTENATRGLWLTLDYTNMSATLEQAYLSPEHILSASQGSVQPLPNNNVFMGYGNNAAFTEYTHDGTVLWDVQFGIIGNASVQSYRAYKQDWTGNPRTNPSIAGSGNGTDNSTIYMSWNGATEISTWAVLAANTSDALVNTTALWKNVTKAGFETDVTVGSAHRYIRAAALNAKGEVLGSSGVLD